MDPTTPLSKPLDAWFKILKLQFVRIRKCLAEDSIPQIASVNFRNAIEHLVLGQAMLDDRASRKAQEKWDEEIKPWWKKDYRFAEFVRLAKASILEACKDNNIPLKPEASLGSFLEVFFGRASWLACDIAGTSGLRNPVGWEKFKIANELFAKSICILIRGDHRWLGTSQQFNLSHLLARLQYAIRVTSSTATP